VLIPKVPRVAKQLPGGMAVFVFGIDSYGFGTALSGSHPAARPFSRYSTAIPTVTLRAQCQADPASPPPALLERRDPPAPKHLCAWGNKRLRTNALSRGLVCSG